MNLKGLFNLQDFLKVRRNSVYFAQFDGLPAARKTSWLRWLQNPYVLFAFFPFSLIFLSEQ